MGNVLRGVPAGLLVPNTQTIIPTATVTQIVHLVATFLYGGMTATGSGLKVPTAGAVFTTGKHSWFGATLVSQ